MKEIKGADIYRVKEIGIYSLDPDFLNRLGTTLERDNVWEILHNEGELSITVRGICYQGEITAHRLI